MVVAGDGDFLLETLSSEHDGRPGWIEKDLACDLFLYLVKPLRQGWLFRWPALRAAWLCHGRAWREEYGECRADNGSYVTVSVPVPREGLLQATGPSSRGPRGVSIRPR